MKEPQKFPRALSAVMFVVAVLFAGFGVLGYAAYGSDVQTVVLTNLPQDQKFVQVSQFLCESPPLPGTASGAVRRAPCRPHR